MTDKNTKSRAKSRSRRFIASAVCPSCGKQDSLYFMDETNDAITCIVCNHKERRTEENTTDKTRDEAPQILRVLDKNTKS